MNNLGLVLIVIVLLGWVAYYYEKLQDRREVLQLRRVKDTLLVTLIPILREDRVSSPDRLDETHRRLLVMIAQHEARPYCAQNKWFLELAYAKLKEVEAELVLSLRR